MKSLVIVCGLLVSSIALAKGPQFEGIGSKISKREGYCSPIDRWLNKEHCAVAGKSPEKKTIEKGQKKLQDVSKKVEKKEDYCSPLDKATGNKKACKDKK